MADAPYDRNMSMSWIQRREEDTYVETACFLVEAKRKDD